MLCYHSEGLESTERKSHKNFLKIRKIIIELLFCGISTNSFVYVVNERAMN